MPRLSFIIPVRHPANARDWSVEKANLAATLRSVAAQDHPGWAAVIVANHGSDLPPLPDGVRVEWVDFPPNMQHEVSEHGHLTALEAVRRDKGRRVLAGIEAAGRPPFVMVLDDDDFVSRRLARFVAEAPEAHGWVVERGYIWPDGRGWCIGTTQFWRQCGSSIILRTALLDLPERAEEAPDHIVHNILGEHVWTTDHFAKAGTPLGAVPFPGAVYRLGHANTHSPVPRALRRYVFNRTILSTPVKNLSTLTRLRPLGRRIRDEFFGEAAAR